MISYCLLVDISHVYIQCVHVHSNVTVVVLLLSFLKTLKQKNPKGTLTLNEIVY